MKCVLAALNSKYIHSNLAIRYLKQYDEKIETFEGTINDNILNMAYKILELSPELLGFSCYIWNIEETIKLCSTIKKMDGRIKIFLGGPEVSFNGEDILKKYDFIDYIIAGEGELTFSEFIKALNENKSLYEVDGLIFKEGNNIIKNQERKSIMDLNIIPFPYKDKDEIPDKIVYYEAARGCPFGCSYCLSSIDKGIRHLSIERVKKELKFFIDNDVKLVKFVDRTFNGNKKFAMEIWSFLIENHKNTKFHFELAGDILDDEELELLSKAPAGLFQFEIGVQTTNPSILKNINRKMDFEKLKQNIIRIERFGNIHCHLDVIAGLPGENMDSFIKSFDMCMEMKPDVLQLGFLKILKGSPIYNETDKYGIKYLDYPPYQVLSTNTMSYDELKMLIMVEKVFEEYYNSHLFEYTFSYVLPMVKSDFVFFKDFSYFLKQKGYFDRSFSFSKKTEFLYEFLKSSFNEIIIKELLLHDYIKTTRRSNIPNFLRRDYPPNIKTIVKGKMDEIKCIWSDIDIKDIIYIPVKLRVHIEEGNIKIDMKDAISIFNMKTGNHIYI
ncbi:MAG TPA: B12-binding domain-containing radical SAM protein, partial [Clostridiaceae bacterium]|nr:B12-binding domain-containing radical SAM protein [Clostridiaceae bacterium]